METESLNIEPVIIQIARFGDTKLALEVLDALAEKALSLQEVEAVAKCYLNLNEIEKAMFYAEKALELSDNKKNIEVNLIPIYRQNAYPAKALKLLEKYRNENEDSDYLVEKAGCLYELNRKEESFEIIKNIDAEKLSEYGKYKHSVMLGTYNLWHGELKKGLIQTIVGGSILRNVESGNPDLFHSRKELNLVFWEGTPDCKKLIIYAEAGVGDEILNIRFMKHLADRGIEAVWYGPWHNMAEVNRRSGVFDLFKESGFTVTTDLSEIKNIEAYMWTYSQYLPINLGLDSKDLYYGPYLKTPQKNIPNDKPKIGIRWYGNAYPRFRNYPLKQLYNVLKDKDAYFYSLQKYEGMDEIHDFPNIIDLSDKIDSFYETAKYINSMDVIITSCTSIAHCAAALGKKTFVFVPISAYYPWCHPTDKSPWYGDNVTLLRQKTPRNWDEPMEELASILQKEKL